MWSAPELVGPVSVYCDVDRKFDLQLLSRLGSTCNYCQGRPVPQIHKDDARTLSNQPTNKQSNHRGRGVEIKKKKGGS